MTQTGDEFRVALKSQKVAVFGLGRSGMAAAHLLRHSGAEVWAYDSLDEKKLGDRLKQLKSQGVKLQLGRGPGREISTFDFIVCSPGIPPHSLWVQKARVNGITLIDEIELAWRLCKKPIVAVTGTNGKTTQTLFLAHVLNRMGKRAVPCGNLGRPLSAFLLENGYKADAYIMEVSSFQLSRTRNFRPEVAVALNLSPNHLDWHPDAMDYADAKARLVNNLRPEDCALLNSDDAWCVGLSEQTLGHVRWFEGSSAQARELVAREVVGALGMDEDWEDSCVEGFVRPEHRMQRLNVARGVEWINDSKSTNPGSTLHALRSVETPAILLMGGRNKGLRFSVMKEMLADRVKQVLLFGEAAEEIERDLRGAVPIEIFHNLNLAVWRARELALPGDTVLLSPACASFDAYESYEERGRHFQRLVEEKITAEVS
ncbi:MAG: UDP-N-acetylmuramoyl-L-alanine--D-glutamate ligase [Candidatus Omnitrophica bacterium]|nr:UDP-N-acetylmuramoyl-L-alanine--D-glutamate ligase [Candidatus Omnitrophota bacterium]